MIVVVGVSLAVVGQLLAVMLWLGRGHRRCPHARVFDPSEARGCWLEDSDGRRWRGWQMPWVCELCGERGSGAPQAYEDPWRIDHAAYTQVLG